MIYTIEIVGGVYIVKHLGYVWQKANMMTFEQSRLHYEITNVERLCNDNYYTVKEIKCVNKN